MASDTPLLSLAIDENNKNSNSNILPHNESNSINEIDSDSTNINDRKTNNQDASKRNILQELNILISDNSSENELLDECNSWFAEEFDLPLADTVYVQNSECTLLNF